MYRLLIYLSSNDGQKWGLPQLRLLISPLEKFVTKESTRYLLYLNHIHT